MKTKEVVESKTQLELAREAGNTWTYEEKEYELYLLNQLGSGMVTIKDGDGTAQLKIGATFAFENSEPFQDFMALDYRDEVDLNTKKTITKQKDGIIRASKLFRETVQEGVIMESDDFGAWSEPVKMTRAELLELDDEIQADLIDAWLGQFHIKRVYEKGSSKIQTFLRASTAKLEVKIGDYENPRHVLLFEFEIPNKDKRRSYAEQTEKIVKESVDNTTIKHLEYDYKKKYQFIRNLLINADGCAIGEIGVRLNMNDKDLVSKFRKGINFFWWTRLADALVNSFGNTGKS